MIRVLADTHVLVSAVIADGKPREFLRRCMEGDLTLVTSSEILREFVEVLGRPKFRMPQGDVQRALVALLEIAEVIHLKSSFKVVRSDPDDDAVLNAAYDGRADYIVSGDRHLLELREFKGIPILLVARFLERVGK